MSKDSVKATNLKLSIIIPCYNCAQTVREAIDSCYTQGFSDSEFEIVTVNDASTDNTVCVLEEAAKQHQNIRIFQHAMNQGGGKTRNTAVKNARAEVIFCLDSDDVLPPGTLSKMYSYLREKDCDGVAFNYSIKFKGRDLNDVAYVDEFPYAGEKIPPESLIDTERSCPLHVVFMFTREAFARVGGYPTHGFDTQGFGWRFLTMGLSAYTCPGTKYFHRVNFHRSYYVREADNGLVNYNWQKILYEHFDLLSDEAKAFIGDFNYADFTRNVFTELKNSRPVFVPNIETKIGPHPYRTPPLPSPAPIRRTSLKGYYLRLKSLWRRVFRSVSSKLHT